MGHGLTSLTYKRAKLRFDFFVPPSTVIEFDGLQHFEPVTFGNQTKREAREAYKKTAQNDKRKDQWARKNNFRLIRIKFDEAPSMVLASKLLTSGA